jgi:hypothetical protein
MQEAVIILSFQALSQPSGTPVEFAPFVRLFVGMIQFENRLSDFHGI